MAEIRRREKSEDTPQPAALPPWRGGAGRGAQISPQSVEQDRLGWVVGADRPGCPHGTCYMSNFTSTKKLLQLDVVGKVSPAIQKPCWAVRTWLVIPEPMPHPVLAWKVLVLTETR